MTKYFKVVIIVLVFSSSFIFSQQRAVQFYLGGYFGLNYNNHIASFNKLDESTLIAVRSSKVQMAAVFQ